MRDDRTGVDMDGEVAVTTRVQLFTTCMVDLFRPRAAIAAVRALERRGVRVDVPPGQTCCGQFAFNAGHHREAAAMGRQFVRAFEAGVAKDGESEAPAVVALSGSCAAMVKLEMPPLLERDALERGDAPQHAARWRQRAETLASRVVDFSQWLDSRGIDARPAPAPSPSAGSAPKAETSEHVAVALHTGCHMRRMLRATDEPVRTLAAAGVDAMELNDAEQCCGFGGSFGLIEPHLSAALADAKLDQLAVARRQGAVALVSSDLGCLMQLGGRLTRRGDAFPTLHLAEVVDLADEGRACPAEIERAASSQVEP